MARYYQEPQVQEWQRAAEAGDAEAMYCLGECCYFGRQGLPEDRAQAVAWYKRGARLDHVDCMRDLGICYYSGIGIGRHFGQALLWIQKAADQGDARALRMLGVMHEKGHATRPDLQRALSCFRQANSNGVDCQQDIARVTQALSAHHRERHAHRADRQRRAEGEQQQQTAWIATETARLAQEDARLTRLAQEQRAASEQHAQERQYAALVDEDRARLARVNARLARENARLGERIAQLETESAEERARAQAAQSAAEAQNNRVQAECIRLQEDTAQLQRQFQAERVRAEQLQAQVQRERSALDALEREQKRRMEAEARRAEEAHRSKREAAIAKQTKWLEARRQSDQHQSAHEKLAEILEATTIDLRTCHCCQQLIQPGTSVRLACLHGVCRSCALATLGTGENSGSIVCSICQARSTLAHPLPPHPCIELELAGAAADDCAVCLDIPDREARFKATFRCETCNRALCELHTENHRRRASEHSITPLPHRAAPLCDTHRQRAVAYCSCRALVCLRCQFSTHQGPGHASQTLEDAAFIESARQRLVRVANEATEQANAILNHVTIAALATAELNERDQLVLNEVDRVSKSLIDHIERHRTEMHDEVARRSGEERAALKNIRDQCEHHWRILRSVTDVANQLASHSHLGDTAAAWLVALEAATIAQLRVTINRTPGAAVPVPAVLSYEPGEIWSSHLSSLGQITQDQPAMVAGVAPAVTVNTPETLPAAGAALAVPDGTGASNPSAAPEPLDAPGQPEQRQGCVMC